jgi:hypothetical protein
MLQPRRSEDSLIRQLDRARRVERGRQEILAELDANERKLQAARKGMKQPLLEVKRRLQQELEAIERREMT